MKIQSIAVITLAITIAVAFKKTPVTETVYGVSSFDATYYYVAEALDGESLGLNYICEEEEGAICTISSSTAPDLQGRILKANATVHGIDHKYVDLTPDDGD